MDSFHVSTLKHLRLRSVIPLQLFMQKIFKKFWKFYEKNLLLSYGIAAFLFTLQLVHLYWLTTSVVFERLFGQGFFELSGIWYLIILFVDYTEIPAIILTSLVYINELRKGRNLKALLFLIFLNSQWLHIFWITDEFVVDQLLGTETVSSLPPWLAWIAILIDYLELPVIADTIKKFFIAAKKEGFLPAFRELKD